jgi:hypothetical protein
MGKCFATIKEYPLNQVCICIAKTKARVLLDSLLLACCAVHWYPNLPNNHTYIKIKETSLK